MSVRSQIMDNVESVLRGIASIREVYAGKYIDLDLNTVQVPVAFAFFGDDREASGTAQGFESFVLPINVEVWCRDVDQEALLSAVHAAMLLDTHRGGNALWTKRVLCRTLFLDSGRSITGFILTFDVLYRHPSGTP